MEDLAGQLNMVGLVALAMGLGAMVGFERERSDKPAGLRTHMLVSGGCCLIALIGEIAFEQFSGIGFLGAGSIIKGEDGRTEGLTTAASVLFVAVMGAAVAYEYWLLAVGATFLAIITLSGVRAVEGWLLRNRPHGGELERTADAVQRRVDREESTEA